jgi:hypothetical protein
MEQGRNVKMLTRGVLVAMLGGMAFLNGCGPGKEAELIVLHTGRLGGNVYPLESERTSNAPLQHYQYLAGYVKKVREEAAARGVPVLLMDSGDSLSGSFASHVTGSQNVATLFNELGYDVVALGNLDADLDPEILKSLKMPVLTPFADETGKPAVPGTEFAVALDKGGVKAKIFANFYGDVRIEDYPQRFPMWFGQSPAKVVPIRDYGRLASELKADEADSLNLFHWMKFEGAATPPAEYLAELQKIGIDAVIAHRIYSRSKRDVWGQQDFSAWPLPVSENILRRNQGFTVARVDLEKVGGKWRAARHQLLQMTANTAPADREIVEKIGQYSGLVKEANEVIGELSQPMKAENILLTYMTALSALADDPLVVYSPESIRTDLDVGPLTASALFDVLPWTTPVIRIRLTPEQLAKVRAMDNLAKLEKPGEELPGSLITSRYFAEILRRELNLDQAQLERVVPESEFEVFLNFAKKVPDLSLVTPPEGSIYVPAR